MVCKALLDMAGVKYDAHYRVTSADPPELVQFIKKNFPDCERDIPRYPDDYKNPKLAGKPITMWNLIPEKKFPPTRVARYCCEKLKETGSEGRKAVTGVRWAESSNRKRNQGIVTVMGRKASTEFAETEGFSSSPRGGVVLLSDNNEARRMVEQCYIRHRTNVNPIVEWTDAEVWEFIKAENVPYCHLYDCGFKRLGCIGCPIAMTKGREREFAMWPKYKENYIRAFEKMLIRAMEFKKGTPYNWGTAVDVFNWWMEYDILPGQTSMLLQGDEDDD